MSDHTRTVFIVLLAISAAVRLFWILEFCILSIKRRKKSVKLVEQLVKDSLLPASQHGNTEQAANRFNLYFTHQVAAYTLGGLALTAWAILMTNKSLTHPERFTLGFLAITVLTATCAAVLFRSPGGEFSRMGYESALAIAGFSLALGTATLVLDSFSIPWVKWIFVVGAALLGMRDWVQTYREMQLTCSMFPKTGTQSPAG